MNGNTDLTYHAACKVEFQSFNRSCSQLTFFKIFNRVLKLVQRTRSSSCEKVESRQKQKEEKKKFLNPAIYRGTCLGSNQAPRWPQKPTHFLAFLLNISGPHYYRVLRREYHHIEIKLSYTNTKVYRSPRWPSGSPRPLLRLESGVQISARRFLFSSETNCRERFTAWVSTIRRKSTWEESVELFSR